MTRVSIIIPCYNAERYVRETIESALSQTRPADEILVIDDGSTDRSVEVAASFGDSVQVIRQSNGGSSVARNKGIEHATGDYLLFLDADDLIDPRTIEVQLAAVQGVSNGVGLMGGAWFTEDPEQTTHTQLPPERGFFPDIIQGNLGLMHAWFVPREMMRKVGGFRPGLVMFEDWECWCRLGLCGANLVPVPLVGALYRRHPTSLMASADPERLVRGHVAVMETLGRGIVANPQLLQQCANQIFWSACVALERAQRNAVAWSELKALGSIIEQVVRRSPQVVRDSRYALLVRLVGLRWATRLRRLALRRNEQADDFRRRHLQDAASRSQTVRPKV